MPPQLSRDTARGSDLRHQVRLALHRAHTWVEGHPRLRWVYRLGVGLLGTVIIVVGVILIPLPGPGWLIVFLGLAVLGTEFPAAHRLGLFLKRLVTRAWAWWRARRDRRVASSG